MELVERRITTTIDATHVVGRKRAALHAHESQLGSSLAAKIHPDLFPDVFGIETFIRAHDTTGIQVPENDLFAGLRGG
jgi:LmbE family N-acetylglucosaminyl deacetylase